MNPQTRAQLNAISVATVTMQLLKRGIRNVSMVGVLPMSDPAPKLVGEAYTVRFVPAREDLSGPDVLGSPDYPPRVAIEQCPPGAVMVIDGRGRGDIAVLGDLLAERMRVRDVAGVVTDGGVRDLQEAVATGLPLYAAGAAAPAHIAGHAAADLQTAVACGGVAVLPGDIIVADSDGAAVIPAHLADEVATDGIEQERYERFAKLKITEGRPIPGVYPPSEGTRGEYLAWIEAGEPDQ